MSSTNREVVSLTMTQGVWGRECARRGKKMRQVMSRAGVGTQDASGRTGSLNDRLIDGAGKGDDKKNDTFAAGCLLK